MGGWIAAPQQGYWMGVSDSPSSLKPNGGGQNRPTEDEIVEKIFQWWISGKSYNRWYAETYLQMKLNFSE